MLALLAKLRGRHAHTWAIWVLLGAGVVLRLRQYLSNRSLWLDEASLALNIIHRPFAGLVEPLEYYQAAPIGFLFVERLAVVLLGTSEYTLRLFPLLCGIASLFLFWKVAERMLAPTTSLIALGLFVVSDRLIYFSSEGKQYSTDVAVALLVWGLATKVEREAAGGARERWWVAAAVGAVAIWFSHPVVFVLAGVGLRWLWVRLRRREWSPAAACAMTCGVWLVSFAVSYLVSLRHLAEHERLGEFWTGRAAPPTSYEDLRWYLRALTTIASLPLGKEVSETVALAGILGGVALFRRSRDQFYWLVTPGLLALLARGLHKYPLWDRTWLFMVPALLIVVAAGAQDVWEKTRRVFPLLVAVFFALLWLHPILYAGYHFLRPQLVEETRPLLEYWREHRRQGEVLYVYYGAAHATRYYAARGVIEPAEFGVGVRAREDPVKYLRDVDGLRGSRRVWLLFSHVNVERMVDEEEFMVRYLDDIGRRLGERRTTKASLYLYDLGQ